MDAERKISFSLVSLQEEKFETKQVVVKKDSEIRVQYLIETEVHPDDEFVYVRSGVRYLFEDSIVCECILGIKFGIEEFQTVVSIDEANKRINFSSNIVPTFLNITYGALRGALYERVKNTSFELFPLPLISMPELEKNNHFKVIR